MISSSAVVVDAIRAGGATQRNAISAWPPHDSGYEVLAVLVDANDLDLASVDDVIMGCVMPRGGPLLNVGRSSFLAAEFTKRMPATNQRCGSSQQSLGFAAQGRMPGPDKSAIAAGVKAIDTTPMDSKILGAHLFGPTLSKCYAKVGGHLQQEISAEPVAERWNLWRPQVDEYGARSQQRGAHPHNESRFADDELPVVVKRSDPKTGQWEQTQILASSIIERLD
jgi:acetyl-CoA acyltransferase